MPHDVTARGTCNVVTFPVTRGTRNVVTRGTRDVMTLAVTHTRATHSIKLRTPTLQTSADTPTCSPLTCSGAEINTIVVVTSHAAVDTDVKIYKGIT